MLTLTDLSDWVEIQDGLASAAEREWEAARQWEFYEKRRQEIAAEIGWCREGR